jgi:hypothetical protein
MKMRIIVLTMLVATSAFAGKPKVVLSSDVYICAFATKAELDACQKAEAEFSANDDPDKEAALKKAQEMSCSVEGQSRINFLICLSKNHSMNPAFQRRRNPRRTVVN